MVSETKLLSALEADYSIVPCLRRATAVNYTDADEDAEKLMSFMDEVCFFRVPESAQTFIRRTKRQDQRGRNRVVTRTGLPRILVEVSCMILS